MTVQKGNAIRLSNGSLAIVRQVRGNKVTLRMQGGVKTVNATDLSGTVEDQDVYTYEEN